MKRAAIVGAGLAGLTAGHRLQQAGWEVEVFESEARVGGRTQTVRTGGFAIDTGASALGSTYGSYLELAKEVGVEVVPTAPIVGIRRDGMTHLLNLDRRVRDGITTRLLSPRAKLRLSRLALDVVMAKARDRLDYGNLGNAAPLDTETARSYGRRALGAEVEQYLCEPIVRTMTIVDTDKVSKVELLSGVANIFTADLLAAKGGQGRLAEVLAEGLKVHLETPVTEVRRTAGGVSVTRAGARDEYDACVIACPLPQATTISVDDGHLLEPLNEVLAYTQCLSVAIGTSAPPKSPAFLLMMPSSEDARVALIFLDHNKAPDRAPAGSGLLSCLWETDAAAAWMGRTDDEIVEQTLASVYRIFPELRGKVTFGEVTRWRQALPLTRDGAYQAIARFTAALDPGSSVQYASDFMSAAGQNTAVLCGNRAAERLARR